MRQLGEQWIEKGVHDSKNHMYVAVENIGESCLGCAFGCESNDVCHYCMAEFGKCPVNKSDVIIKDLGILNEDGCLPEERTGKYPTIKDRNEYEGWRLFHIWDCIVCEKIGNDDEAIEIRVSALTRQEAIDRWNRRA